MQDNMQALIERIEELKQENLRLKNRNRQMKRELEHKEDHINYLRNLILERDEKLLELAEAYKNME